MTTRQEGVGPIEVRTIDHVQLVIPAGGEDRARAFYGSVPRCYVRDPFGDRIELVYAADAGFTEP